jgi:hypothetical protein
MPDMHEQQFSIQTRRITSGQLQLRSSLSKQLTNIQAVEKRPSLAWNKQRTLEPVAKLMAEERQSCFEAIFGIEWAAWRFHEAEFKPGNESIYGRQTPLMSFAIGSLFSWLRAVRPGGG